MAQYRDRRIRDRASYGWEYRLRTLVVLHEWQVALPGLCLYCAGTVMEGRPATWFVRPIGDAKPLRE